MGAPALPLIVSLKYAPPEQQAHKPQLAPLVMQRANRVQKSLIRMRSPVAPLEHGQYDPRPLNRVDASSLQGAALFGALTLLIAHAPDSWKKLHEGPVQLGPATVDGALGGGLGFNW